MAAGQGYKEFATGDILTAADANGYLASQVVMVFANAAARTTAITSPQQGMVTFLKSTNSTEYYSGSAWVAIGGSSSSGALTLVTSQTFTASSSISFNNCFTTTYGNYKVLIEGNTSINTTANIRMRQSGSDITGASYETRTPSVTGPSTSWSMFASGSASLSCFAYDMTFFNPKGTAYPHITFNTIGLATGVNGQGSGGGGFYDGLVAGYDGFSMILGAGTFTGTIRIYGYSN